MQKMYLYYLRGTQAIIINKQTVCNIKKKSYFFNKFSQTKNDHISYSVQYQLSISLINTKSNAISNSNVKIIFDISFNVCTPFYALLF